MIFTPQQIDEIMKIIDWYAITFIAHQVSPTVLSQQQQQTLQDRGININSINANQSNVTQAYKFGLLSTTLQDAAVKQMTYDQFKKYLSSGKMFSLSRLENNALQNLQFQTANDVSKLFNKIKGSVGDKLVAADKKNNTVKHSAVVTNAAKRAIENRKSVNSIVSDIGRSTELWNRDLGRIADYVLHTAFDEGRAMGYQRKNGDDALVYKDVYPGACNHCIKAYLKGGVGSEPKLFKLSELRQNATNVGRKVKQYKPVIGPHHPNCYDKDTEVLTNEGWKFFKDLHHKELFLSVDLKTQQSQWVNSINKVQQHYKGPMYHFTNNTFDLMTTPNHNHVIRTYKSEKLRLINTDKLPTESWFLRHIPQWKSTDNNIVFDSNKYNSKNFAKWMGWYLSEGCVIKYVNNRIHLTQIKYVDQLYKDCKDLFTNRRVTKCKGYIEIGLLKTDKQLIKYLKDIDHSNQKYIPRNIKELSKQSIQQLLYTFCLGDGSVEKGRLWDGYQCNDTRVFHTSSKQLADDLGELLLKIGKRPSFKYSKPKQFFDKKAQKQYIQNQGMWLVRECKSKYGHLKSIKVDIVEYDDMIYDVELQKNHTLVVRRNGKVVISGNCRCTLQDTPNGLTLQDLQQGLWKWDGKDFERDMSKFKRKVKRNSKVKVTVNGKTTEI